MTNRRSEPSSNIWTLADAEARLSEIIDRVQTRPQVIMPSVVLVSAEEWARRTVRKGTLADFLLASPLREASMDIERVRDRPQDIEL